MWVVKIGGSLQDSAYLTSWLEVLHKHGRGKVVIVPGGGKFADAVRVSQQVRGFDDNSAHHKAIRAMERFAHLLKRLSPELQLGRSIGSLRTCLANNGLALWLPLQMVVGEKNIPASWDVTSDGLAAWLAIKMQIDALVLVKSTALPAHYQDYAELAHLGLIDPFLVQLLNSSRLQMNWMQSDEYDLLADKLRTEPRYFYHMQSRPPSTYGKS